MHCAEWGNSSWLLNTKIDEGVAGAFENIQYPTFSLSPEVDSEEELCVSSSSSCIKVSDTFLVLKGIIRLD